MHKKVSQEHCRTLQYNYSKTYSAPMSCFTHTIDYYHCELTIHYHNPVSCVYRLCTLFWYRFAVSCIQYHVSSIMYPVSCILYHVSMDSAHCSGIVSFVRRVLLCVRSSEITSMSVTCWCGAR